MTKISKRQSALSRIRYDYATNGKDTGCAMRAMSENRISYEKYKELAREGLEIFKRKVVNNG